MAPDATQQHVAAILNAWWMVRHYPRQHQRAQREQAIRTLGLAVRAAFNASENFEPLIVAVVDGGAPHDYTRRF